MQLSTDAFVVSYAVTHTRTLCSYFYKSKIDADEGESNRAHFEVLMNIFESFSKLTLLSFAPTFHFFCLYLPSDVTSRLLARSALFDTNITAFCAIF